MSSFLSKLKSTVSEALPGNPLSGDYDIQGKVIGTAGPDLVWKIYKAYKKTTKEAASVFVFDKKSIDKASRDDKKLIIASLKRGVQQLTKLRHPKILSVVRPVEENRDCLAFATEPVWTSLANILESSSDEQAKKLDEVEIKYGLIQVMEAVSFLHHDVKLVHGGIHPSSIIINDKTIWKLFGFDFFSSNTSSQDSPQFEYKEWCSGAPKPTLPDLNYIAPECGNRGYCDTKSDMFSLGVTVHAIYNQGKPVYQCHDSLASFKQLSSEMRSFRSSLLRNIPSSFHDSFKSLLSLDTSSRPDAKSLLKIGHFEDMLVMTVVYLDSLVQRDNLQKSQYFKNLPNVLNKLPLSICLYRILPTLFSECSNKDMIPFVLQNVLIVAEMCSKLEYCTHLFPKLVPIFKLSQPVQIPLLLLKNMPILLSQTSDADTKTHILPMLFTCIELDNSQLQELCLDILPEFSLLIDKHSMKTSVIPRIKNLCISTQYLSLRVKGLISIGKMVTHMDKWFVVDEVLPFLQQIPSKEPTVLMAILGIYKIVFTSKDLGISKEQLATKSLPFLLPLSVDHSLSKQQFMSFMSVIKAMMSTVEKEHMAKLEETEHKQKQDSDLKFNGHQSSQDSLDTSMQGFLSEAGLVGSPATKPALTASIPLSVSTTVNKTAVRSTAPQVKDLTATLGSVSIQPVRQPSAMSSIRPLSPSPAALRPQASQQVRAPTLGSSQHPTRVQQGSSMQTLSPLSTTKNNSMIGSSSSNTRNMSAGSLNSSSSGNTMSPNSTSFGGSSMGSLQNQSLNMMGTGRTQTFPAAIGAGSNTPAAFGGGSNTPAAIGAGSNTQSVSWNMQPTNQMSGWSSNTPGFNSSTPQYGAAFGGAPNSTTSQFNMSANMTTGLQGQQSGMTKQNVGQLSQSDLNDLLG